MPDLDNNKNTANGYILVAYYPAEISARLSDFFQLHGYGVYVCDSFDGLMALDMPDLSMVVMDISSKDESVYHAIEMLKQMSSKPNMPILVSAEHPDTERIVQALNAGAYDYIVRPYSMQEILMRVRTLLSAYSE